jgi:hypothetical protein
MSLHQAVSRQIEILKSIKGAQASHVVMAEAFLDAGRFESALRIVVHGLECEGEDMLARLAQSVELSR